MSLPQSSLALDPCRVVLRLILYSLYTYDRVAIFNSITTVKFADNTVVVGLISNSYETACLETMKKLRYGKLQ